MTSERFHYEIVGTGWGRRSVLEHSETSATIAYEKMDPTASSPYLSEPASPTEPYLSDPASPTEPYLSYPTSPAEFYPPDPSRPIPARKRGKKRKRPESPHSLAHDIGALRAEGSTSDAELRTESGVFPVHKLILSARSPVFKRVFADERSLEMKAVDAGTMGRLLAYLYCDDPGPLDLGTASTLYEVADRYAVRGLLDRCSAFLIGNLNTVNAIDVLVNADRHRDEHLREAAQEFLLDHEEMFRTPLWRDIIAAYPTLAAETMIRKYTG